MNQSDWLTRVQESVVAFLDRLKIPSTPGLFLHCIKGLTQEGRTVALGFSCFALKIYYALGLWDNLSQEEKTDWIHFLKSFQTSTITVGGLISYNAFIDEAIITYLSRQKAWYESLMDRVFYPNRLTYLQRVIIAETKQAVATLAQVGESADRPYRGFPITEKKVTSYLSNLDWTHPWGAGAHLSALAVFLTSQAPRLLQEFERKHLLDACLCFIESLADKETGAYFKGPTPAYGMLINGAMKILTALDWLKVPIHYPARLIDTCLQELPLSEGCHLVDVIYVLYRCSQHSQHRRGEVQAYCTQVLAMIKEHYNPDGGFSYNIGKSQVSYYGVPVSKGYAVSDIHGTCLLTWAAVMILEILEKNWVGWKVIRP